MSEKNVITECEQSALNNMNVDRNMIRSIYWSLKLELSDWDIRNAFTGGTLSAIVYVIFLKYISDNSGQLGLQGTDQYRIDNLIDGYYKGRDCRELYKYLNDVETQLGLSRGVFQNFVVDIKSPNFYEKFFSALKLANELDFRNKNIIEIEIEELIVIVEKIIESEGRENESIYTPSNIAIMMSMICQIEDGMSVYDPCAGCGIALVQAVKDRKIHVFAQEINRDFVAILEMLLIIAGVREGIVRCDDSIWHPLTQTLNQKFDRIVSEPPYMKPDVSYRTFIDSKLIDHILYYPEQKIEDTWIFVRHIVSALRDDGRAVILLPMSMLTREGGTSSTRKKLIEDGYIDSVIELPLSALSNRKFKMSILVLKKKKSIHNVYMIDLSRGLWDEKSKDGVDGISAVAKLIVNHEIIAGVSDIVGVERIEENGYQLAVSRYITQEFDMAQFLNNSTDLYQRADELEEKFVRLCKEFKEALKDYNRYCNEKNTE